MNNLFERDAAAIAGTYARFPVEIVSGSGSVVTDVNGKRYIDLGSGIGVTAFGIADPVWREAVTAQLAKVQHTSNLYYTGPCVELAELLCRKTGMQKVFFCNSGAEANECVIKVARKWAHLHKGADCSDIVTLRGSFHGRTVTTLAATGQDVYHREFGPLTPGFLYAEPENFEQTEELFKTHKVAAVFFECVQGEGGVVPLSERYASFLAQLCQTYDCLLAVDEVQSGNGRTGTLYAYEQYGLTPDLVSTAKGLGGGLPLGAALMGEKTADVLGKGDHGSTFGGNPVCCAGGVSILKRIDDGLLAQVREKSRLVTAALQGAKGVQSVSGRGLMLGVKTDKPAADVVQACLKRGVLCLTAKDKVRLLPALNIPTDLLMEAVDVLKAVCAEENEEETA